MNVLSLFSGIGGIDLGLERAGHTVVAQSEVDSYCCRALAKHWPDVPNLGDVKLIDWNNHHGLEAEIICGGFPCQDVSDAGTRSGIDGEFSGLWAHFAEAVRVLRPRYALVENVSGLLARGMGRVVGDLAAIGYDSEWDCLPAAAFGAPHLRARLFLLAYPSRVGGETHDALQAGWPQPQLCAWWATEPEMDRVAHGLPRRLVGLANKQNSVLGNSCVPQVAEHVGRLIAERFDGVPA